MAGNGTYGKPMLVLFSKQGSDQSFTSNYAKTKMLKYSAQVTKIKTMRLELNNDFLHYFLFLTIQVIGNVTGE